MKKQAKITDKSPGKDSSHQEFMITAFSPEFDEAIVIEKESNIEK